MSTAKSLTTSAKDGSCCENCSAELRTLRRENTQLKEMQRLFSSSGLAVQSRLELEEVEMRINAAKVELEQAADRAKQRASVLAALAEANELGADDFDAEEVERRSASLSDLENTARQAQAYAAAPPGLLNKFPEHAPAVKWESYDALKQRSTAIEKQISLRSPADKSANVTSSTNTSVVEAESTLRLKYAFDVDETRSNGNLPFGWQETVHASGLPIYYHAASGVMSLARPFDQSTFDDEALLSGRIPISAMPCLYWQILQQRAADKAARNPSAGSVASAAMNTHHQVQTTSDSTASQDKRVPSLVSVAMETGDAPRRPASAPSASLPEEVNSSAFGHALSAPTKLPSSDVSAKASGQTVANNDKSVEVITLEDESSVIIGSDNDSCEILMELPNGELVPALSSMTGETNNFLSIEQFVTSSAGATPYISALKLREYATSHGFEFEQVNLCKHVCNSLSAAVSRTKKQTLEGRAVNLRQTLASISPNQKVAVVQWPNSSERDAISNQNAANEASVCINPHAKNLADIFRTYLLRVAGSANLRCEYATTTDEFVPVKASLFVNDRCYGTGFGPTKRQAHVNALAQALTLLLPGIEKEISPRFQSDVCFPLYPPVPAEDMEKFDKIPIRHSLVAEETQNFKHIAPGAVFSEYLQAYARRTFGASLDVNFERVAGTESTYTMKFADMQVTIVCPTGINDAKLSAIQAILAKSHPQLQHWGELLRTYILPRSIPESAWLLQSRRQCLLSQGVLPSVTLEANKSASSAKTAGPSTKDPGTNPKVTTGTPKSSPQVTPKSTPTNSPVKAPTTTAIGKTTTNATKTMTPVAAPAKPTVASASKSVSSTTTAVTAAKNTNAVAFTSSAKPTDSLMKPATIISTMSAPGNLPWKLPDAIEVTAFNSDVKISLELRGRLITVILNTYITKSQALFWSKLISIPQPQVLYQFSPSGNEFLPVKATAVIQDKHFGSGYGLTEPHAQYEAARKTLETLIPGVAFARERHEDHIFSISKDIINFLQKIPITTPYYSTLKTPQEQQFAVSIKPPRLLTEFLRSYVAQTGDVEIEQRATNYAASAASPQQHMYYMKVAGAEAAISCSDVGEGKMLAIQAILAKLNPGARFWAELAQRFFTRQPDILEIRHKPTPPAVTTKAASFGGTTSKSTAPAKSVAATAVTNAKKTATPPSGNTPVSSPLPGRNTPVVGSDSPDHAEDSLVFVIDQTPATGPPGSKRQEKKRKATTNDQQTMVFVDSRTDSGKSATMTALAQSLKNKFASAPAPKITFPTKASATAAKPASKNGDSAKKPEEDIVFVEHVDAAKRRKRDPIITELNLGPTSVEKSPAKSINDSSQPDVSADGNVASQTPIKAADTRMSSIEELLEMFAEDEEDDDDIGIV